MGSLLGISSPSTEKESEREREREGDEGFTVPCRERERERERLSRREHAREQIRSPTRASINSRFRQVRDAMVDH